MRFFEYFISVSTDELDSANRSNFFCCEEDSDSFFERVVAPGRVPATLVLGVRES